MRVLHSHSRLHVYADVLLGMTGRVERLMRGGQYALVSLNAAEDERRILGGVRLVLHLDDLRVLPQRERPEGPCRLRFGPSSSAKGEQMA
ncbi:hypothetical protein HNP84_009089 [Thermocatellispora tengchongensis]|uniref:Uncharacterized protein n=1 Tax=Thermocatellispora tengchongensis TaxID=1073253 RepID=A0A840PK81_9ACTN|nr:hypothetical protein [Thermocatellispora tengchongensis]MBB5139326.1 hypothetical protein [Thermocatellispora tengchongensis]